MPEKTGIIIYVLLLGAYVIGSIPTGVLLSRLLSRKDVRKFGSGNIGTANMTRMLGLPVGLVTLLLDAAKGYVAVLLPVWLHFAHAPALGLLAGMVAIVGHAFSCFLHFKGGKSVATTAGVLLAVAPKLLLIALGLFLLLLAVSSMVSVASVVSLWGTTVICATMGQPILVIFMILVSAFVTVRHHANIKRLLSHSERTISYGLVATWQRRQHHA